MDPWGSALLADVDVIAQLPGLASHDALGHTLDIGREIRVAFKEARKEEPEGLADWVWSVIT